MKMQIACRVVLFLGAVPVLSLAQDVERIHEDLSFVNFESPHVHPLDLSPNGQHLAACNTAAAAVEIFDVVDNTPRHMASVPVGLDPVSARFRNDEELWVVNHVSDSVSIVDLSSRSVNSILATLDEPADVVFAGDPSRAYVTCSQVNTVQVFDLNDLSAEPKAIVLEGEDPRALAVSPDGRVVYAAVFESGNGTTLVGGGSIDRVFRSFPPNAVDDPAGPYQGKNPVPVEGAQTVAHNTALVAEAPKVAHIVKRTPDGRWLDDNDADWTALVSGELAAKSGRVPGWDLADHDVAMIDTASDSVSYVRSLMNSCMALAVHPQTGAVTVVGTEAMNHIRFEPNLKGTFIRVRQATFVPANDDDASIIISDLNPHLDYQTSTIPQAQRDLSIGDPRAIAWMSDGSCAYIAGMGSNNVIVVGAGGDREHAGVTIEVGEGPTGLAINDEKHRLYVLNRFDSSISTVSTETNSEISRTRFFDPTPERIRAGRRHLYDTHKNSGLGQASCASCHIDGRMDRLAWDLGDPTASSKIVVNRIVDERGFFESETVFHPMKGPMVTATLQGIMGNEPFHWRGDKTGLEDFNITFENLLGDDSRLTEAEMLEFKQFLATLHFPPNPNRSVDNSLKESVPLPGEFAADGVGEEGNRIRTGNAKRGESLFRNRNGFGDTRLFGCQSCHIGSSGFSYPVGDPTVSAIAGSRDGLRTLTDLVGSADGPFRPAHLRNLYEKTGFDATSRKSLAGFGFMHDGGVDTLTRFLGQDVFHFTSDDELADLAAFLFSFAGSSANLSGGARIAPANLNPYDVHAGVGHQLQFDDSITDLDYFKVVRLVEMTRDAYGYLDLIARGTKGGEVYSFLHDKSAVFLTDRGDPTVYLSRLLTRESGFERLTFTLVPGNYGEWLTLDRDGDGLRFGDEVHDFEPAVPGVQNPFDPERRDSTGDNGSTEPDGIPDGENDFDGDSVSNSYEFLIGTNPISKRNTFPYEAFRLSVEESSDGRDWILRWKVINPNMRYQVESSEDLVNWNARRPSTPLKTQTEMHLSVPKTGSTAPRYFRVRQIP